MSALEVVVVQPVGQRLRPLQGRPIGGGIGPAPQAGPDEAFRLAVGARGVRAGPEVAQAELPAQKKPADDAILGEFNRLKQRSSAVAGLLTSEIRALLNEITAFKNKLSRDGKLFIDYGREFNELQEIGATVESALRARSQ